MKRKRIVLIGKDGSRWSFSDLTGLPHPKTNSLKMLGVMAQAAVDCDEALDRYEIIGADGER